MKAVLAITVLATGCASSYQSAHPLAKGKTQVTTAITRGEDLDGEELTNVVWTGDLQIRHGLSDRVDAGLRVLRTPVYLRPDSAVSVDAKVLLVEEGDRTAISIALPVTVSWHEDGTDPEDGNVLLSPTLFVGMELVAGVELVVAPRLYWLTPAGDGDNEVGFGASVGVRLGDASRAWAVHPEIALVRADDRREFGDTETYVSFGIGISAGN